MSEQNPSQCLYLIHSMRERFSEREQRIADYILSNPAKAVHPSIEELAESIGVSVSTLVRFVKKLGFKGYQQFRIILASEALAPETRIYETPVDRNDDPVQIAFGTASRALEATSSMVDRASLFELAELIVACGRLHVFGLGGSAIVAKDAMHKLIRTGITCIGAEDYHIQLMLASQMRENDVALVISHTGANRDALRVAETAKTAGAHLCVITSYPRSALARMADRLFLSASSPGSFISEAFSARIAQLALVDALYIAIMEKLGAEGISKVERMRAAIARRRI